MRNLRKLTAAVLAIAIVLTSMTAAFAATDATAPVNGDKAIVLNDLGLYAGTKTDSFEPDLGANLTRQQATVLLLKMFGLADKAAALTDEEVATALKAYTDADKIASWAKKATAYVVSNNIMSGMSATTIDPTANVTGAQYATLIVKSMGYKVDDFKLAVTQLSKVTGSKVADEFADADLTRDGAVGYMYGALTAETADKTTVIANLVAENPAIADKAIAAGIYTAAPATVALDVKSAVALSSKIVEVTLGTAATAADVAAATFAVKDSAAKEFKVVSAALAGWGDGKSVLVTLEADTTAGTLYTLTTGTKTANFGGRAADTTKPTIKSVTSTDFNKVTVEFNEAVKIETAVVEFAEKYGSKAVLAITDKKYDGNTKIVFTTANQKMATLYGATVTGTADLAGNVMDKDDAKTFSCTVDVTAEQEVVNAYSNNPEEATIKFKAKVDPATINAAAFKVEEMYGSKAVLAVTAAKMAVKDLKGTVGETITDTNDANDKGYYVVITVPGMKTSTLYKVTATGVTSTYAKGLKTDKNTTTFGGNAKPTEPFTYLINNGTAESNTSIKVVYANKVDKATAENIANYAITEAYGSKTVLAVTKAALGDDEKTVTLTTAAMKNTLYTITVTNVKDVWTNAIKTADSKNIVNFSGVAVFNKITKVATADYGADAANKTVLYVTFDQKVAADATDVSKYTIDGSVGYPLKAEIDGTNSALVKLTLPELTQSKTYTLTVKNLANIDGVAMDAAGITKIFVGRGTVADKLELVAVVATDKQTLDIYFDRDVTDSKIAGPLWNKTTNTLSAIAFKYVTKGSDTAVTLPAIYAYQSASNKNILTVRTTMAAFDDANKNVSLGGYKLVIGTNDGSVFKTDKNSLPFSPNSTDVKKVVIDGVMSSSNNKIRVYFNQPTSVAAVSTFAKVATSSGVAYNAATITLGNAQPVDGTNKTAWDFSVSSALAANSYWLVPTTSSIALISDTTGIVTLETKDDGSAIEKQFAGSSAVVNDITGLGAFMVDNKTIRVQFPEPMNATTVKLASNYNIVAADGTTPVTMSDDSAFTGSAIGEISYESDTTKTDTYMSATITLNKTIKTATGGAFIIFNQAIANATNTAYVKDGTSNVKKQVAISTADSSKVTLSEASFDNTANTLTIKFNMRTNVNTTVTGAAIISSPGAYGTTDTAILAKIIGITAPGTTTVTGIQFYDDDTEVTGDVSLSANDFNKIVITFADGATTEVTGEVTMKEDSVVKFVGINANNQDKDSKLPFAQ